MAVGESSPFAPFVVPIEARRADLLLTVTEVQADSSQRVSLTLLHFDLVRKHVPEQSRVLILWFRPLEVATERRLLRHGEAEYREFLWIGLPSQEPV